MSTPQHNSPPPLPSDSSPTVTVSIPAPLGALGNMARERLNQITALETQLSSATEKRLRDAGDIVSHASTLPDTLAARTSALVSELEAQLSSATEARLREVTDLTSQAAAVPRTIATQASTFSNDMTAQASALTNDLAAQASALSATLASQQTSASTQVPASSNTPFGAVKTMLSQLSPVPLPQTIPAYHHPVPEGSRDILADAPAVTYAALSSPTQAARRTAETTLPAASVSSHGGGGGRVTTPPRGTARVTRSYPALPDASHPPPRPIPLPGADLLRRPTGGPYGDSDTAWQARDDREPCFREKTVVNDWIRLLFLLERTRRLCTKGKLTGFALNLAIGLQVLIGALTTALGAALSGKNVWSGSTICLCLIYVRFFF
ncbi:hypothetical protein B0F90DRAFT_399686 [Multifurca ochricompacta]|uniref:SMODS and SLOG-associating 2TM effector domain-containing protein n=1 Tax=Multifurca ochricompacta TaxID=376703 RepID=A0AAD4M4B5_9AGAM|nr:hypothetical protein B0F90DRAFT_399686 [Multifurca ochricompacta]